MAGVKAQIEEISQQVMQGISQLLKFIGDGTDSAGTGVVHPPNVQISGNNARQVQAEETYGSTLPVLTDGINCYHPYNRYSPGNAVAKLRRQFPTTSVSATRQGSRQSWPISTNTTG